MVRETRLPGPLAAVLASAIGGVGGACGVWLVIQSFEQGKVFLATPKALTWLYLIGLLCAAIIGGAVLAWRGLRALRAYWATHRTATVVTIVVLAVLFVVAALLSPKPGELHFLNWSTRIVVILAGIVGILGVLGVLLVDTAARTLLREVEADHETVELYLGLRRHLHLFLWILGGLTGVGTFTTGALRIALIAAELLDESVFPLEYVLAYGGSFTCLVGLVYIPTYLRLAAAGRRIREAFCPMSTLTRESFAKWQSERKSLDEILHLRVSAGQSFGTGMAVLAPLLASAVSVLLGG
jgi:hypothetical protein